MDNKTGCPARWFLIRAHNASHGFLDDRNEVMRRDVSLSPAHKHSLRLCHRCGIRDESEALGRSITGSSDLSDRIDGPGHRPERPWAIKLSEGCAFR